MRNADIWHRTCITRVCHELETVAGGSAASAVLDGGAT